LKLVHAVVKDYRSLSGRHEFDLSEGLNYLVGPNNVGKSNVLRAIELALDPIAQYHPDRDRASRASQYGRDHTTRIVLTFEFGSTGPDKTLRRYANAYERALKGEPTYQRSEPWTFADEGRIRHITEFGVGGARVTKFETKGKAALSLSTDREEHKQLDKKFREVVRFAVVHSGEDIESLLTGKFRDILHLVLTEHLRDEVARAEAARTVYLRALQAELLEPLRAEVESRVGGLFTEVSKVELLPAVPSVQETIASVEVRLEDAVSSSLSDKGTGIRGGVLVAMLQYLAAQNRRSLVFAIEEPESFLHPAAQEGIRSELESLAKQADVTLLVTTHSPHIVSRAEATLVTKVAKDASGVTHLSHGIAGSQRLSTMFGAMYGDPDFLEFLESSLRLDNTVHTVVVTEGYTDGAFMEAACRAAGRDDLVDGVAFLPAGGTTRIVSAAVLAKAATSRPVIALLDWDENGKVALERLTSMQHDWNKNTNVLSLQRWPDRCRTGHEVEIEDLLDPELVQRVVDDLGHALAVDSTQACRASDITHIRLSTAWKDAAVENLDVLFSAHQNSPGLIWLAEEIQRRATTLRDS
jgi:putative ATP-dependent endonuclease of OLD family